MHTPQESSVIISIYVLGSFTYLSYDFRSIIKVFCANVCPPLPALPQYLIFQQERVTLVGWNSVFCCVLGNMEESAVINEFTNQPSIWLGLIYGIIFLL